MKTSEQSRIFSSINKFQTTPLQCVNYLSQSWRYFWSALSDSLVTSISGIVDTLKNSAKPTENDSKPVKLLRQTLTIVLAHVGLAGAVTNAKSIIIAFARFCLGLVFIIVLAPCADFFYTRFDINDRVSADVWYYESWYWLWLTLGPYMAGVLEVIGVYFCLIHKSTIKSFVLAFCMMYDIGKILWLIQVQNHDQYNTVTPEAFIWYGLACSVFVIIMLNLLSFWLFHRLHAFKRRLFGIAQIADKAEPQVIVKSFVETMEYGKKVGQFNL
jgi:hypothetical protein